jgi:hypothetical protein
MFGQHELGVICPLDADAQIDYARRVLWDRFGNVRIEKGRAHLVTSDYEHFSVEAFKLTSFTDTITELDITILSGIGLKISLELNHPAVGIFIDDDLLVF